MTNTQRSEESQAALWNGSAGLAWVETQELLDRMFAPFEEILVAEARARRGRNVLDVGCGTGATTLAMARAFGPEGRCTGVDISEPMIELARARAARDRLPATFVCADAQSYELEPASADTIVSRFGVMFFADPAQAFANLRRAASAGGELRLIAWRGPADNPFMTAAERAAAPLLPQLPPRDADAPGQFAFADRRRVHGILERSGWIDIDIQPIDVACAFPAGELDRYLTRLGPLARALPDLDELTRQRVVDTVRPAFDPYLLGDEIRFDAACWMIGARSPAVREPYAAGRAAP